MSCHEWPLLSHGVDWLKPCESSCFNIASNASHKPTRIKDFKDIDCEFLMESFEPYALKVKLLFEAFSCMVVLRLRGSTHLMFGLL